MFCGLGAWNASQPVRTHLSATTPAKHCCAPSFLSFVPFPAAASVRAVQSTVRLHLPVWADE